MCYTSIEGNCTVCFYGRISFFNFKKGSFMFITSGKIYSKKNVIRVITTTLY